MAGFARQVIRLPAVGALALVLGVGPLLAELCETRCAHAAATGTRAPERAVDHAGCPHTSGAAPVVTTLPAPHACAIRDVNAAMLRQLDWSSVLIILPTASFDHTPLDRLSTLRRVESRHRPRGSPSTTAQLRI